MSPRPRDRRTNAIGPAADHDGDRSSRAESASAGARRSHPLALGVDISPARRAPANTTASPAGCQRAPSRSGRLSSWTSALPSVYAVHVLAPGAPPREAILRPPGETAGPPAQPRVRDHAQPGQIGVSHVDQACRAASPRRTAPFSGFAAARGGWVAGTRIARTVARPHVRSGINPAIARKHRLRARSRALVQHASRLSAC